VREPFSHSHANEADHSQGQTAEGECDSTAGESIPPFAGRECPKGPHGSAKREDRKFPAQVMNHSPRLRDAALCRGHEVSSTNALIYRDPRANAGDERAWATTGATQSVTWPAERW
jgi:hypothetical protein